MLIRQAVDSDRPAILAIVNDAAQAYRGVIPADRWHEPYMPADELERERKGVGTRLLRHVEGLAGKPLLIGTWASASWAIDFYQRNGYTVVTNTDKDRLLRTYWSIPPRQIETSVVLADRRWMDAQARGT